MKRTAIVGVGALGSHAALLLRNESDLTVVDFDRIEAKNVLSQFHGRPNVGKNKAEAFKHTMHFMWGLKIHSVPHRLWSDNTRILDTADLIVDCVDNAGTRKVIQEYARKRSVACLHGALAADGQFGRVVWDERFVIDDEGEVGAATCEDGEHLPFISIVSGYIAKAAQTYLKTGKKIGFEVNPGGVVRT